MRFLSRKKKKKNNSDLVIVQNSCKSFVSQKWLDVLALISRLVPWSQNNIIINKKKLINGEKLIIFQRKHDLIIDSSGKNISRFQTVGFSYQRKQLKNALQRLKKRLTDRPQPCNKTGGQKVFLDGLDRKLISKVAKLASFQSVYSMLFLKSLNFFVIFILY